MAFTVFYAWQSDREPASCRFFIRDSAKAAIKQVSADAEVRSAPAFDHATQGETGLVHIAETIKRKIRGCGVFLADLTFVANYKTHDRRSKRATNANVAFDQAARGGGYGKSYAISNPQEYWAEGAQAWFDCANPRNSGGAATRAQLKEKDPALAELLTEVYGDGPWRYRRTTDAGRAAADVAHLAGMDRTQFPVFSFNLSPRIRAAAAQAPK